MADLLGKQPLHIFRGDCSGHWYATNRYTERAKGGFVATAKEDITDQVEAIIAEHTPLLAPPDVTARHRFEVMPDDDGVFFIFFPDLPGCMTQADTWQEIVPMAFDAYQLWTESVDEIPSVTESGRDAFWDGLGE